jgi:hypothetical protein
MTVFRKRVRDLGRCTCHPTRIRRPAATGEGLLAACREWKMLRALARALTTTGDGWTFDALFSDTGPNAARHQTLLMSLAR